MRHRESFLDVLRIICIVLVLYVHTGENAMYAWLGKSGPEYWFGLSFGQLACCGTSVFFVISGYLLLHKNEEIQFILKHRVARYVGLLLFFGLTQQIYASIIYNSWSQLSIHSVLNSIYSTSVIGQYWFLYEYLVFLLILVFLRGIANNLNRTNAHYLMWLFLIFEVIMVAFEKVVDFDRIALSLPILETVVFLPLIGFCIRENYFDFDECRKNRVIAYLAGVISLVFSVFYSSYSYKNWGVAYSFTGAYVLASIAIFVFVRQICNGKDSGKIVSLIGKSILFIYLAEVQLKDATYFVYESTASTVTWYFAAMLWIVASMMLGVIVASTLRLIPGVKKII